MGLKQRYNTIIIIIISVPIKHERGRERGERRRGREIIEGIEGEKKWGGKMKKKEENQFFNG